VPEKWLHKFHGTQVTEKTDHLEALMKQAINGDKRAYAVLLQETSRFLRPFLAKRLNMAAEVDDLMQEILISIHKARHTYDGERPYKPWAYAIARYRLQDHLRLH
jgi:RNA polymerase sigma-70 factor (ECF subfamily)